MLKRRGQRVRVRRIVMHGPSHEEQGGISRWFQAALEVVEMRDYVMPMGNGITGETKSGRELALTWDQDGFSFEATFPGGSENFADDIEHALIFGPSMYFPPPSEEEARREGILARAKQDGVILFRELAEGSRQWVIDRCPE